MKLFKLVGEVALNGISDVENQLDGLTGTAEKKSSAIGTAFKKLGGAIASIFAIDKIKDFGVNIVQTAATVQAETAQFEAAFKDLAGAATDMFNRVSEATGIFATRLQVTGTKAYAQLKGAGLEANDALAATEQFLNLAADAAAYYDISLEDAEARIRSFLRGNVEAGDAIGLFTSESQRNSYALEMYGNKWIDLTEAQKQMLMLNVAQDIYDQAGATGQATREADGLENVTGNLKEVWRQFLAVIGSPVLQFVTPIIQKLTSKVTLLRDKVNELKEWIANNQDQVEQWKTALENIGIAIGTVTSLFVAFKAGAAIQSVVNSFQAAQIALSLYQLSAEGATIAQGVLNGTLTFGETVVALLTGKMTLAQVAQLGMAKAQGVLNAVMAANPIGLIVMAIAALVAAFVILWNKCDWFRNFWIGLWEGIKTVFAAVVAWIKQALSDIGTFFSNIWTSISDFVTSAWETIKNVVQVGIMFIGSILQAAFDIITLPFRFIWENCKDTIISAWEAIKSAVHTAIEFVSNIITTVGNAISSTWNTIWTAIKNFLSPILDSIKSTVSTVFNAIKSIISSIINGVKTTVTNVFNAIKTAISTPLNAAKTIVANIFNGIKNTISDVISGAKNIVKSGLDAIKGFFDKLKIKFPNLKLPHFSIKGKFSLDPPSVPKLAIDWYAKGGILTEPTAFGVNPRTGSLRVGGEAGDEAVAPIDTLMSYIRTAVQEESGNTAYTVQRLIDMLADFLPQIVGNMDKSIVLNDGTLVGKIAPKINQELGRIRTQEARGGKLAGVY